jgi:indolepyruvate ferredoxin oxidoreductase beta subunit
VRVAVFSADMAMTAAPAGAVRLDSTAPFCIAVMALGGQGGGVLVDWIVALYESQGCLVQSTSVPGVAQRTGATVYYIEALPLPDSQPRASRPVFSLMPVPGEVDLVIGAELMEAGRAIQRGLVTPDRTMLITSSHRAFSVTEKQAPGDGTGNAESVYAAASASAKTFIAFDMARIADASGSAISAVLFGALAGSNGLPFPRAAFEAAIRSAGIGVDASLRGFALGYEQATNAVSGGNPPPPSRPAADHSPPAPNAAARFLVDRIQAEFPPAAHSMLLAGLARVVDFQDVAYGKEYLDLIGDILILDNAGSGFLLTQTAAKYVAVAMAYDDVFRVADLKTRGSRFERVRSEIKAAPHQIVYTTEFMHPRAEEVCGSLPLPLGSFIEKRPAVFHALNKLVSRPRRVKTGTIVWFTSLYVLGGLKRWRRGTLRHARETAHRNAWLLRVRSAAARDYDLAVELLKTRRLVKGYSDTHARGQSKFDKVMAAAARLEGRPDAGDWTRRLCDAALKDEEGVALSGALKTIDSFL